MKIFILILIFSFVQQICFAQPNGDSGKLRKSQQPRADSFSRDSGHAPGHVGMTSSKHLSGVPSDSGRVTPPPQRETYHSVLNRLLSRNKFLNLKGTPVLLVSKKRQVPGKEYLFYLISGILVIFGAFKLFYSRYFHHIFRVFFNTSLRQNQLTDILLQAKLASLIFNVFFVLMAGLYLWLLVIHYYPETGFGNNILLFCIGAIGITYIIKFCVLKFVGWVTGMSTALNTYIFVVFLINKIIGIVLIPVILALAFAPTSYYKTAVIISLMGICIFFVIRFFRSYGLLQQEVRVSGFHFLLYIVSLEVLPLLIVYKLALRLLLKM